MGFSRMKSLSFRHTILVFQTIVLALGLSTTARLQSQVDHNLDPRIRTCTEAENQSGYSVDVRFLIAKTVPNQVTPIFARCEAVDLPWLPEASILRFHTPFQVDYSETFTFVRTTEGSKLCLIRSGEGMYVEPNPNDPNSLGVLNDLLMGAKPTPDDSALASISNLYLFLLDREGDRLWALLPPVREYSLLKDYEATIRNDGSVHRVWLRIGGATRLFSYSRERAELHLDSVLRVESEKVR